MGIKAIREKYKIEHLVQNRDNVICIGSGYIHDIIVISFDGKIIKKYKNGVYNDGWSTNENLKRYQEEMIIDEENGELKKLIDLKDDFKVLLPIFTVDDGVLIETFCEKYDFPNTTIEGYLIYENTFFKTREEAIDYGLRDCKSYIKILEEGKQELEEEISKKNERINMFQKRLVDLETLSKHIL
jgi:hypothetical protein